MRKKEIIAMRATGLFVLIGLTIYITKSTASALAVDQTVLPNPTEQTEQIAAEVILMQGKSFQSNSFRYEVMTINENKKTGTVMLTGLTEPKQEVVIPETVIGPDGYDYTVTQIAEKCFYGNTKVTSIYIPSTIRNIRGCAFSGCKNLKKIIVDKYNLYYKTQNNALYSKDGTKLVALLNAGISYTPPRTVKKIESGAFVYCKGLESITIPKTVKNMGMIFDNACPDLKTITFQRSKPPIIEKCIKMKDGRITQLLCNIDFYHAELQILVPKGSESYYHKELEEIFKSNKVLPLVPYKKVIVQK